MFIFKNFNADFVVDTQASILDVGITRRLLHNSTFNSNVFHVFHRQHHNKNDSSRPCFHSRDVVPV